MCSLPDVNQFFPLVGPTITPSFNDIRNRQNEGQTNRPDRITSTLAKEATACNSNTKDNVYSILIIVTWFIC